MLPIEFCDGGFYLTCRHFFDGLVRLGLLVNEFLFCADGQCQHLNQRRRLKNENVFVFAESLGYCHKVLRRACCPVKFSLEPLSPVAVSYLGFCGDKFATDFDNAACHIGGKFPNPFSAFIKRDEFGFNVNRDDRRNFVDERRRHLGNFFACVARRVVVDFGGVLNVGRCLVVDSVNRRL